HALGLGTAPTWNSLIRNGAFVGPNAVAVYGGPVPLAGTAHWADGITVNGQPVALDPTATLGGRVTFSALDTAALRDVGWNATPAVSLPAVPVPPAAPVPPPFVPVPIDNPAAAARPVVLTGPADGTARAYSLSADGY